MAAAASEVQIDEVQIDEVQIDEVQIEGGFVKASFAGLDLIIAEKEGLINATHLCQSKGKTLDLYRRSQAEELKFATTRFYNLNPLGDGTYVDPCELLDVAAWLAPQTYIGAAVIIDAFYKTVRRQCQPDSIFNPNITAPEGFGCSYRIVFSCFFVEVDERGWIQVTDSVCAPEKTVDDFETQPDSVFLLKYFRIVRSSVATFYHPLLFLRLVAWGKPTCYGDVFRLIFRYSYLPVMALFRQAIAAAGASLNSIPAGSLDKLTDVCAKGRDKADEALTREQLEKLEKEVNGLRDELKYQRLTNAVLAPFKKKYDEAEKQLQELRPQLVLGEQISKLQNTLDNLGISKQ